VNPALLLDTHVWLWLALGIPRKLRPQTIKRIEQAATESTLGVSIVSVWEIGLLEAAQRLRLPMTAEEWVAHALKRFDLRLIGLDQPRIVLDSCRLPGGFHADPADRVLVATARAENAVLVTRDKKILDYGRAGHVRVLAA
jgi:PIN domain nuclease of toxin-antitoxin system